MRLYNRALSSAEVSAIYTGLPSGQNTPASGNVRTASLNMTRQSSASTTNATPVLKAVAISCQPGYAVADQTVVCEVRLDRAAADNSTAVSLSSDSASIRIPASVGARSGQSRIRFQVAVAGVATQTTAVISAQAGGSLVETKLTVLPSVGARLAVTGDQTSRPGSTVHLNVIATDENGMPLRATATNRPSGSIFDPATGAFEWQPTETDLGDHQVAFAAGTNATKAVSIHVGTNQPAIERLENGANAAALAICSPGSIATLSGHSLYTGTAPTWDYSGASTELDGTRVLVNGVSVSVLYASTEHVAFLCPTSPAGTALHFAVETPAGTSNMLVSEMAQSAPGIFTVDSAPGTRALAIAAESGELSQIPAFQQPGLPVLPEQSVVVRATGIACDQTLIAQLSFKVEQQYALIQSVRPAPHYDGVCEITIQTPNMSGDAIPIVLETTSTDGHVAFSNTATLAVASRQ